MSSKTLFIPGPLYSTTKESMNFQQDGRSVLLAWVDILIELLLFSKTNLRPFHVTTIIIHAQS